MARKKKRIAREVSLPELEIPVAPALEGLLALPVFLMLDFGILWLAGTVGAFLLTWLGAVGAFLRSTFSGTLAWPQVWDVLSIRPVASLLLMLLILCLFLFAAFLTWVLIFGFADRLIHPEKWVLRLSPGGIRCVDSFDPWPSIWGIGGRKAFLTNRVRLEFTYASQPGGHVTVWFLQRLKPEQCREIEAWLERLRIQMGERASKWGTFRFVRPTPILWSMDRRNWPQWDFPWDPLRGWKCFARWQQKS